MNIKTGDVIRAHNHINATALLEVVAVKPLSFKACLIDWVDRKDRYGHRVGLGIVCSYDYSEIINIVERR